MQMLEFVKLMTVKIGQYIPAKKVNSILMQYSEQLSQTAFSEGLVIVACKELTLLLDSDVKLAEITSRDMVPEVFDFLCRLYGDDNKEILEKLKYHEDMQSMMLLLWELLVARFCGKDLAQKIYAINIKKMMNLSLKFLEMMKIMSENMAFAISWSKCMLEPDKIFLLADELKDLSEEKRRDVLRLVAEEVGSLREEPNRDDFSRLLQRAKQGPSAVN